MTQVTVLDPADETSKDGLPAQRKAMSFGLQRAARRGSMSTTTAFTHKPAIPLEPKGEGLADNHSPRTESTPINTAVQPGLKPQVEPPVTKPVVSIGTQDQTALSEDRTKINSSSSIAASFAKQDLIITASAAKALTKLFAALAQEPGSGNEVPAAIREKVLSKLIKESHLLADRLARVATGEGVQPSVYLRSRMLQQAVEYISDQWVLRGELNTNNLYEVACAAFKGEVPGLNQEVVDLFHRAGEYTPADTEEISQARITEAVIRASWKLTEIVNTFDRADYDGSLQEEKGRGLHPFSYARAVPDVVRDLTHAVLAITKENKLKINALDIATTWTQNSIDRAATLVGAEYKLFTDRSLRASFLNDLTSEASLGEKCQQYDTIMQHIHRRARNSFIVVEKNALDVMSAKAYKRFLPKQSLSSSADPNVEPSAEVSAESISKSSTDSSIELSADSSPKAIANASDSPQQASTLTQAVSTPAQDPSPAASDKDHFSTEQPSRSRFGFSRYV